MSRGAAAAVALIAIVAARPALAAPPAPSAAATTAVAVAFDVGARALRGRARITFTNPTASPLDRIYLWLYPQRFARPSDELDDLILRWVYPRGFSVGSMALTAAAVDGAPVDPQLEAHASAGRGTLWALPLAAPLEPGRRIEVALDYTAVVPVRYGGFGCAKGQCTLLGGLHPMLAAIDGDGWDLEAPPQRGQVAVALRLAEPADILLCGRLVQRATEAQASLSDTPYATLVVAPHFHSREEQADGVRLRWVSIDPPPPADDARGQLLPYTQEDHGRFALEDAAMAVEVFRMATGADPGAAATSGVPDGTLTLVQAPLRLDLAQAHPGLVAVSDRYYRIFPARRFRKFHQRQLVRAVLAALAEPTVAAGAEARRDIDLTADAAAGFLSDAFVLRRYRRDEKADDILRPVGFVPAIDHLLYAGQTPFSDAYFGGVRGAEALRDDPRRFMDERPRGRLYYEKLRDLLPPADLADAMTAVLRRGVPLRAAAAAAYGSDLDWFFRQWSGAYPRHDVRLDAVESRDAGDTWHHRITVERRTAPGDREVVEPVTVLVRFRDGTSTRLRWDGRGRRGTVTADSTSRIRDVVLDPDSRLAQSRLPGDTADPRFDDRTRHPIRLVYNSFGVLFSVSDLSALLAADFSIRRRYDVENAARLSVYRSSAVAAGINFSYSRSSGPPVTADQLLRRVFVRASAARLDPSFFSGGGGTIDDGRAATRYSFGLGYGADDTVFYWDPWKARTLLLGAALQLTRRDAAPETGADWLVTGSLSATASGEATPRAGHTFAGELQADAVVGELDSRVQLLAPGGISGLRSIAPAGLFGRASLLARGEYRLRIGGDLDWNLGHYNFVRSMSLVAYTDVGSVSPCDGYDLTSADGLHAGVGLGLQFLYDSFGTLAQMGRIDVAVPLTRRTRACLGAEPPSSPPVMVYVSFAPTF